MDLTSRILYTSAEVRAAVVDLFRHVKSERVAIVAYVGDGAEAYLPAPKGIRLVCSPTPGGTNPNTIRALIKKRVIVQFVDSLHMKVYWAEGVGCIITSANLTTNALGVGGLLEAGVLLGPGVVDIELILKGLKRRPAEGELHRLDRKHKDFYKRVGWSGRPRLARTFVQWFESPMREKWKMFFFWTAAHDLSDVAIQAIQREFSKAPHDWIWSREGSVNENDWILCGYAPKGRVRSLTWLFADSVFSVPASDRNYDPEFPYEVIQVHSKKHYPPPPFSIDAKLRSALTLVCKDELAEETATPFEMSDELLARVRDLL